MTDSALYCSGCDRQLGPDDLYCPRCGTPTAANPDPHATLLVGNREDAVSPPDIHREVTDPRPSAPSAARASDAPYKDRLRQVLGAEFQLLSLLGEGGFARVYKALDRRLDRIVAIKVIRPEVVGTELFVESFRSEGVALAKLRHPGIVPIYDIRERGGLIYYTMPFVEGVTLEKRLDRARLPPYESRRILAELSDALAAAHRAKMVHLDIKPDNVFLEGDLQKVLLVDFGIAMAVTETVPDSAAGPIVGTPAYMSPEQAQGLPEIDHRSDIYSLGALGYRMLMGRPPFTGRNADEVLRKHIEEAPVSIRKINPSIPKDFADTIMRCLEKDPWERFATMKELGVALQSVAFFGMQGEAAARTSRASRASTGAYAIPAEESSGMERTLVILITVVALLIGVLIGGIFG